MFQSSNYYDVLSFLYWSSCSLKNIIGLYFRDRCLVFDVLANTWTRKISFGIILL